ncbi:MAG: class I SAM-dependent methyltransferase [Geminicoccaceae bacterium]
MSREAPGSDRSTLKALSLVRSLLPGEPLIADFACGPGSSVIALSKALPGARFLAIDTHQPFVDEVKRRASAAGVERRIDARVADMADPPCEPQSIDMIWCEGALYFLGVKQGLLAWRAHLKPGGLVVFNDAIWLVDHQDRAQDLKACWADYASMTDENGVLAALSEAGYEIVGGFELPDSDWWDDYYSPMEAKLQTLEETYWGQPKAAIPLNEARQEIDIRRRYPDKYAYRFFAARMNSGRTQNSSRERAPSCKRISGRRSTAPARSAHLDTD